MSTFLHKWLLMPFAARFVWMPGRSYRGPIVLDSQEQKLRTRLEHHVRHLSETIGVRHHDHPQSLAAAVDYIDAHLRANGYEVEQQQFPLANNAGVNVVVQTPGKHQRWLVIGAHYDTVPQSPGANDNGSGVAALLELATLLRNRLVDLPFGLRLVFFGNEERVNQPREAAGSYHYAQRLKAEATQLLGMWSLESIGCYSMESGSQAYPSPFNLFYPTTGNFVAFIGNTQSSAFVRRSVKAFRKLHAFPSEGVAAPEKFADIGRSDHWGFWRADYPALMVTDTSEFRSRVYHTADDTPDKVDFNSLARVTRLLAETVPELTS